MGLGTRCYVNDPFRPNFRRSKYDYEIFGSSDILQEMAITEPIRMRETSLLFCRLFAYVCIILPDLLFKGLHTYLQSSNAMHVKK